MPADLEHLATGHLRTAVARGRDPYRTVIDDTVEFLDGYGAPADLRVLATRLAGPVFAAHLEAQATWPERTDNDRLTDAFRALDAAGIVAREDFACCQNCGAAEIVDEVLDRTPARGYVFYHQQDAERAAEGGSLWLAFGALGRAVGPIGSELTAPGEAIGAEIVAALRAEGLTVDWDGSAGQRLHVRLRWQRRRHGRFAHPVADRGPLTVAYESLPSGPRSRGDVPMVLPEAVEVLRRLPTRTDSWLSAVGVSGGIVQMRWVNGRLWLETPDPAAAGSTGKHATLAEAERMLTVLATEDRVAIAELPGAAFRKW